MNKRTIYLPAEALGLCLFCSNDPHRESLNYVKISIFLMPSRC